MEMELKFKSIGTRWFVNVFAVFAAVITIVCVVCCVAVNSLLLERVRASASEYAQPFSVLAQVQEKDFIESARRYAQEFEHKDKIEVQIIDKNGNVFVTTNGFEPITETMPDYEAAVSGERGTGLWRGKNANGEPVLAETTVLGGGEEHSLGAVRFVVSLKEANRQSIILCAVIIGAALLFLGFSTFSGVFFIRSIAKPIRDVSNSARKIAMGEFKTQIETDRNDEIGELCDAVNYMASELDRAENLKNDFISSVSHELRTPLTPIRGWGETAKMSIGSDDGLVEKGLDVVLNESERLSKLVEELLDFSRMQSGRLTVNVGKLNVTRLVFAAADMYVELAKQRGIEVVSVPPKKDCEILGDADRLKQVFVNIIDNAVKYTESGGQVLIEQYIEESCVRIVVKDTGAGIPAADLDRVKEKFFKSNKTVRGSGIGLAVADEIVKQHQGLLFIESTEGIGTTATIVFPLFEQEQEVALEPGKLEAETNQIQEEENNEQM
jgi:signal transduction histidine kinase